MIAILFSYLHTPVSNVMTEWFQLFFFSPLFTDPFNPQNKRKQAKHVHIHQGARRVLDREARRGAPRRHRPPVDRRPDPRRAHPRLDRQPQRPRRALHRGRKRGLLHFHVRRHQAGGHGPRGLRGQPHGCGGVASGDQRGAVFNERVCVLCWAHVPGPSWVSEVEGLIIVSDSNNLCSLCKEQLKLNKEGHVWKLESVQCLAIASGFLYALWPLPRIYLNISRWSNYATLIMAMDNRCDDGRFLLSAHNCQVPNPKFRKPGSGTANLEFWYNETKNYQCLHMLEIKHREQLNHQFLERLKSTIKIH